MKIELTPEVKNTIQIAVGLLKGAVRRLFEDKGYAPDRVPCERSMRDLLATLGFHPRKVVKSWPLRKIKETDAIFTQVHQVKKQADADPGTIRVPLDTKAVVAKVARVSKLWITTLRPNIKWRPLVCFALTRARRGCILRLVR